MQDWQDCVRGMLKMEELVDFGQTMSLTQECPLVHIEKVVNVHQA